MQRGSEEYMAMMQDWWDGIPEEAAEYILSGRVQDHSLQEVMAGPYFDELCIFFEHCLTSCVSVPGMSKAKS